MKTFILSLLICCITLAVKAQGSSSTVYEIKGIIADSSGQKALDYVTVGLKSDKNIPLRSIFTKSDGSFTFSNIKPGTYSLTAISVGYKTKTIPVNLTDSTKKVLDLGLLTISARTNKLKEVIVTADKPLIRQEVDRISYDLQADPESKSSNVLEMMRKVPLLSVDGDDNILLKGNSGYKIFINGKPSSMMERNPKDILKSMPASSIQSIEVITNPPSKYDAEGLVGIINIITNKKVDNGYNGSINVNERFPAGGPGTGGSFTFKQGKFGLSAFGGASLANSPVTRSNSLRTTTGDSATDLAQYSTRESDRESAYFGTELSYEIDSLNLVSGQFNINGNQADGSSAQKSVLNGETGILQGYNLGNNSINKGNGLDVALNYQLGFKKNKARLLTFSYRYYTFENKQINALTTSDRVNYEQPDYNQSNNGGSSEQTMQLDYVHPVKKLTIEAGLKGIIRNNQCDYQFHAFDSDSRQFKLDPAQTNTFENSQEVYGAYNSYQYNLKNWGLKAGLRIEKTIIDADFISAASQVRQEYFNMVPSVNINRKFKDMSSVNFGFTQRVKRPGIHQLNPFVDRSNPNFESTGNPNLHPTVSNMFQLGYSKSKKGSFNFMLAYMHFDDLIMPVVVTDSATFITRNSYDNTGKARAIFSNFNVNYPITKKLNFSLNGGIGHGRVEGLVNGAVVKNQGFMYHISSTSGYRLEKNWRVNASVNMHGPNLSIQGTSNSSINTSFSVNKDLVKDKLSFSASVSNPFAKYRNNHTETFGPNFLHESDTQTYYRGFNTSLNYKFGKLKDAIKKNKRGISNDDVSSGSGL